MLYVGTLFPPANSTMLVSTVTDNLFAWNMISEEVVGISFAPITNANGTELNGEITWGVHLLLNPEIKL